VTNGFTTFPKKVVLRIFIGLKIHCHQPGLNPRTMGPIGSRITTDDFTGSSILMLGYRFSEAAFLDLFTLEEALK
jgi:hypothetical protein